MRPSKDKQATDAARVNVNQQLGWNNVIESIHRAKTRAEVVWAHAEAQGYAKAVRAQTGDFAAHAKLVEAMESVAKLAYETTEESARLERIRETRGAWAEAENLKTERDFWVEQCRVLQNQLQSWQQMYGAALKQLARGATTDDNLRAQLSEVREAIREPVVGVEAVMALAADLKGNTQGRYTAMATPARERIASEGSSRVSKT